MNIFKRFISGIRNVTFDEEVHIILLDEDVPAKLKNYVKLLSETKYEDGSYHTYYGEIKRLINSFIFYWTETMDQTKQNCDKHLQFIDKDELLRLVNVSIKCHKYKQKLFFAEFLPIENPEEEAILKDLTAKYKRHIEKLYQLRDEVESLDKQNKVEEYAKTHLPRSVKRKNEVFQFAYTFTSMMLADYAPNIRGSLVEILQRLRNNLKNLEEKCEANLNNLLHQLYDKNKEQLLCSRQYRRSSKDAAEIEKSIEHIREQIVKQGNDVPISRLKTEVEYFESRMNEFNQISNTLCKLKAEQENVEKEIKIYNSMCTTELPGSKAECWHNMADNLKKKEKYLKETITNAAKSLLTFFSVRGQNRMIYTDNVGPYYICEYGHQVYFFDSGLRVYHIDCEGNYHQVLDTDAYYYDDCGRYVYKDDEKVYQIFACTSQYKLGDSTLLEKISKDCGHGEKKVKDCRMKIKDHTVNEILPMTDEVDITGTLEPEVTQYLWESVGAVLPEALNDVAQAQPKNPIHYLAHKLLLHKYSKTTEELRKKKLEADAYRLKILEDRKEKAKEESRAWKKKQVPRRKPEESDDAPERALYDAYLATNELIHSLNTAQFYCD